MDDTHSTDPTNIPQSDTPNAETTQAPINEPSVPDTQPTDTVNPVGQSPLDDATHPAEPALLEQEAAATVNVTQNASKPRSSGISKAIVIFLIVLMFIVVVVLGYYLMLRLTGYSTPQVNEVVTPAPTTTTVSPTPKNEQEEVDEMDTTFPESDVDAIQKDIQGL